ncbi:MAG: bifunctional phosphoribosylaminoimidazolecarboxamide formyltransferase/IMP cyclohydrolase, partial [Fusobacteriaceae bacterium]|nr:bifunctional phosphoribosylaminoimidazolecarboxamide formyltransferase/IMP cyclohydrolase [Fusobacteriaceae bacterium]
MKRVLISVSDKRGIVDFANFLEKNGYEIISTGGTEKILKDSGIKTLNISEITGFPEIMDGRVKTLHPNVHGGLLCVRDNPEHMKALLENNIELIDMVIVNLYPFKEVLEKNSTHEELIENIDIGGPSMLRSAAKNHKFVTVCVDPADYKTIQEEIEKYNDTTPETKNYLAAKVFRYTSSYDSLIANYLTSRLGEKFPEIITLSYEKVQNLRYGENPHQEAAFYKSLVSGFSLANAEQLNGKELSFNNIQDTDAALKIIREFKEPAVVAVKHMNPCGVASGIDINSAWKKTLAADPVSIFGGIIVANREIDQKTAEGMGELFLEIIVAPSYTPEALDLLSKKKNLRVLKLDLNSNQKNNLSITNVCDGILIQDTDNIFNLQNDDALNLECVT